MNQDKPMDFGSLDEKERRLRAFVRDAGRPLVAFSGGVDSSLLAKIARDETPAPLAVTVDSVFLSDREREEAERLAGRIGIEHRFERFSPLDLDEVRENGLDRCYYCKKAIFGRLGEIAAAEGYGAVLDGGNVSDLGDYRPGRRAVEELGIDSPLARAGLVKGDVRALSRRLGVPGADRPAAACLASRIPYGRALDAESLRRVATGEDMVRRLGFVTVRLRLFGKMACIELGGEDFSRLPLLLERREEVTAELLALGFDRVVFDLSPYRTGSLNPPVT